jgi:hypothetical protein
MPCILDFFLSSIYFTASFRMYSIVNFSGSNKKTRVILRLNLKDPLALVEKSTIFRRINHENSGVQRTLELVADFLRSSK